MCFGVSRLLHPRGGKVTRPDFRSLSVKDLLDARDAYHVHLTHLKNVVATAIGRYRFSPDDARKDDAGAPEKRGQKKRRTLRNSVVTERSWPCVLVFVKEWIDPKDFGKYVDDIVPKRLYLPDGRVVPTCVLYAERQELSTRIGEPLRFPGNLVGGGFPALSDVQGEVHVGTVGCLVSDGASLYALTNRHVAGQPGAESYTLLQGEREVLGRSHARQVGKLAFERAYGGFAGSRTYANLDAGLIRIDDTSFWTSQVYGIGEFGELLDLHPDTISLDLIGRQVRAYGASSGLMLGEIQGLFYRYRSVGGFDYVSDFLIGPRAGTADSEAALSRHGNSGALWFLEQERPAKGAKAKDRPELRPIALHWGGQTFGEDGGTETEYALATSLSTICRELDVDLVSDLNVGMPERWGKVGHYKIGAAACHLVTGKLATLMRRNLDRVAFSDEDMNDIVAALNRTKSFVALADVPDIVWKSRTSDKRGRESPNHFADMDQRSRKFEGKNLLELCRRQAFVDPGKWNEFYESIKVDRKHRGLLPFRVWQFFQEMVASVRDKDVARYVCAAGVLAHYVGDACQPLHVSELHDGHEDKPGEKGVHSAYETKMLDANSAELVEAVNRALRPASRPSLLTIGSGRDAAKATIELMKRSIEGLPPERIIEAYVSTRGRGQPAAMWEELGEETVERFADGANVLASIWQGAWEAGGGGGIGAAKLVAVDKKTLTRIYKDKSFVPSVFIDMMTIEVDELRVVDE